MRFGWRTLVLGGVGFVALWPVASWIESLAPEGVARYTVARITGSWVGVAQIAVLVGGFILLYQATGFGRRLRPLAAYGRMSLTAYVTQALFWVPLYYGFGFALHDQLGATVSVLVGLPFLAVHIAAANGWLRRFRYGPLEWFWRACTLRDFGIPFRRAEPSAAVATPQPAAVAD